MAFYWSKQEFSEVSVRSPELVATVGVCVDVLQQMCPHVSVMYSPGSQTQGGLIQRCAVKAVIQTGALAWDHKRWTVTAVKVSSC